MSEQFVNNWPSEIPKPTKEQLTHWEKCPRHQEIRRYDRTVPFGGCEYHCIGGDVHIVLRNSEDLPIDGFCLKEYIDRQMEKACKAYCQNCQK